MPTFTCNAGFRRWEETRAYFEVLKFKNGKMSYFLDLVEYCLIEVYVHAHGWIHCFKEYFYQWFLLTFSGKMRSNKFKDILTFVTNMLGKQYSRKSTIFQMTISSEFIFFLVCIIDISMVTYILILTYNFVQLLFFSLYSFHWLMYLKKTTPSASNDFLLSIMFIN